MKKKSIKQGDMKIASEEDLLTLDANTGKKTYRYFTPEDYRLFEEQTIHIREVAQRAIDETRWDTGEPETAFEILSHVNCILRARLGNYRQLVKVLRRRAYVTLYNIYDAQMEQLWRQLTPTLTEFVTLKEKILKSLMDLADPCPASVLEDIVGGTQLTQRRKRLARRLRGPQKTGHREGDGEHTPCAQNHQGDRNDGGCFVSHTGASQRGRGGYYLPLY